jgi:hypothetical protein
VVAVVMALGSLVAAQPASADIRSNIASQATSQVSVNNTACTNPPTNTISRYDNSCGIDWCAEFARWAWTQGGVTNITGLNSWAHSFKDYGKANGTYHDRTSGYTPQPGDAVVFDYASDSDGSSGSDIDHVAIVTGVSGGNVNTVGGNQGWNDPNITIYTSYVQASSYSLGNTDIVGYTSPVGIDQIAPVSVVSNPSSGGYDAFARDTSGALTWWSIDAGGNWSSPIGLGGSLASSPSAVVTTSNTIDVFYKGTNGDLWHRWKVGSNWYGPQDLGMGPLGGPPRALGQPDGTVDVFWQGTDEALWSAHYSPGTQTWTGATPLGGSFVREPWPVVSASGVVSVFLMGTDSNLWEVQKTGGVWQAAVSLGMGPLGGPPAAIGHTDGTIDVFWKGTTGELFSTHYSSSTWSAWVDHGGTMNSDPYPVQTVPGTIDVFYTGASSNLYHSWLVSGTWFGPQSLGMGPLGSPPSAGSNTSGVVYTFWKGTDGGLWNAFYQSGTWYGPVPGGGSIG